MVKVLQLQHGPIRYSLDGDQVNGRKKGDGGRGGGGGEVLSGANTDVDGVVPYIEQELRESMEAFDRS